MRYSGLIRRFVVEDMLALHWCRKCFGLVWRGHRGIHDKWHEHLANLPAHNNQDADE